MNTAPPRLVVHALPGGHAQEIATALAGIASGEEARQDRLSADDAGQQLAQNPDARLCIVYEDPVRAICAAMSAKEDIGAFLRNWTSCADHALTLHRRNRRRSTILEAGHLQRFAAAGLARLDLDADSRVLGEIANPAPPPAPLDYVLAQAILVESAEAQSAHEELIASAQVLSNEESPDPADRALQAYEALRQQQDEVADLPQDLAEQGELQTLLNEAEERHTEAENSNGGLRQQLEEKTAQLDLLLAQQTAMISDMEALEQEVEATKTRAETLQQDLRMQLKAEEDTRERAILERDQRTAELKAAVDALERSSADLAHRDGELAAAQGEIHRIMNSRSMRLTRSLRRISGLLRGRR